MDAYKKLALEFPGINKTIQEYTSGNIDNHLNQEATVQFLLDEFIKDITEEH